MAESDFPIRLLVLDDEDDIHETVRLLALQVGVGVEVFAAASVNQAVDYVDLHHFDVVLIDLFGADGSLAGLELLRYLGSVRSTASVVLMTHLDLDMHHTNVMNAIASSREPHVVRFIDKRISTNLVNEALSEAVSFVNETEVHVEGLDFLAALIHDRGKRYKDSSLIPLREPIEIAREIERLCRSLFADRVYGTRQTRVDVEILPIERLGLSAAVVVRADIRLGMAGVEAGSPYQCVLKVGPRNEIAEEAGRFLEFVQFGVRLEERVELLAHAQSDSLGAVVYSMAGGSRGAVRSLDELFVDDPERAREVVARLFAHTSWYHTQANSKSIKDFFQDTYRTDFATAFDLMKPALNKAVERLGGKVADGASNGDLELLDSRGLKVTLPSRGFTGTGRVLRPSPWCLVHGDMHGGNVMVEPPQDPSSPGRVSLIDYRQAGPGPRCIDAAALECAIRLADAHQIEASGQGERECLQTAFSTAPRELALLEAVWSVGNGALAQTGEDLSQWFMLSSAVSAGARGALKAPPLRAEEYVLTCLLYGLRQLRYPMPGVSRLRLAAWVGANYQYLSSRTGVGLQ